MNVKSVLLGLGWISVLAMIWLFFFRIAPINFTNILIFILVFVGVLFATAVGGSKPTNKSIGWVQKDFKN